MIKNIFKLFLASSVILISGCVTMADSMSKMAGLGVIDTKVSTFDGATIVEMSPAFLYNDGMFGNQMKLGASWNTNSPGTVALILAHNSDVRYSNTAYLNLSGIDINIDGAITSHNTVSSTIHDSSTYNPISRTIYTKSSNAVTIPYSMLIAMINAKDCRLRIHGGKGYEDSKFSIERIPGGQGTAIISMREFVSRVDAMKAK